jgi:hypothetical protein
MPWTSRFLVLAVGFFILAGAVAAFLFLGGSRSISSENVEITAQGPVSIGSGDTVAIVVTVKNTNPAAVTNTNLVVDLPPGARQAADKSQAFDHYTDTLGTLAPGEETSRTVNVVLFGAQNEVLTVPIRVSYGAEGSNADFASETEYKVTVTTSPLALTIAAPQEAASGQPFTVGVVVRSNSSTPLENAALEITYPPGFSVQSTSPAPVQSSRSGALFSFGTLSPGQQQTVSVTGTITGQHTDERVFRFSAGVAEGTTITLPYASTDRLVRVAQPFLATTLTLNRNAADTIFAAPGESVSAQLMWQNNLTVPVSNAQIIVKLSGNGFDPANVYAQSGFYRSSDATILFSKDTNRELAVLQPGASGTGAFSVVPKSATALRGVPNPTITLTVSIAGNRIGQNGVPEAISSTVVKTIKVGTQVEYGSRVLRTVGPFRNTGPVPPRPDVETTYTVELSAVNSVNSLGGASAAMVLPSYVRFTGAVSPAGSIVYDERTRTVTWRVNDMDPNQTLKAHFQVALLPSASQKGISPVLVSEQIFTGTDRFTKEQVSLKGSRLTTQFADDPSYQPGQGLVTQ